MRFPNLLLNPGSRNHVDCGPEDKSTDREHEDQLNQGETTEPFSAFGRMGSLKHGEGKRRLFVLTALIVVSPKLLIRTG